MSDVYKSILERVRKEMRVQGSRFICTASPTSTQVGAKEFVQELRHEFHQSTHTTYAYSIGELKHWDDDGEPSGTAGRPILKAIERAGLTRVVVVVTRFFGGKKLGTAGLIRAYGGATESTLRSAEHVTYFITRTIKISFPHDRTGDVMHVVSGLGAAIVHTSYDEEVHLVLEIRTSRIDQLKFRLIDATHGNINIHSADSSTKEA